MNDVKSRPSTGQRSAVIYCRVSTREQVDNTSLGSQQKLCEEFCKKRGSEVVKIFVEEGKSAKTLERPEFRKMIDYCGANKKTVAEVVVYDLSRFSRSSADFHLGRALLARLGIRLLSVRENYDETPAGNFMTTIIAGVYQLENDNRAEKTRVGMRATAQLGRWPFKAPLGYLRGRKEEGTSLVPDPNMAPLLKMAFEMVASGAHTANEALRKANSMGLRTQKGKRVNPSSFNYTLRKPVYAGLIVVKEWPDVGPIKGDFEPLIPTEVFDRVQLVLSGRKPSATTHKRFHQDFPLRRFVGCGYCDKPLTGSWSKGRKKKYAYYRCSSCKKTNIRKEKLEEAFECYLERLTPRVEFLDLFEAVVLDVWKTSQADAMALAAVCKGQLDALLDMKDKLDEAFLYQRSIDNQTYQRQQEKLQAQILEKRIALSDMECDEFEAEAVISFARSVLENARSLWTKSSPEQQDKLQSVLFPKGVTFRDGNFGTSVTAYSFCLLQEVPKAKSKMATRHGLEP